ncbi:flagellar basal body L-ring protein FlgH [Limnohabitans sp. 2KL-27]|uniref:flagellar basal body L-ring protein FlgH n=1 Tax=Limnohabitans sp. 2KL-27 TaxID=1100705 RepID=UPI000A6BB5C9|nr:flagellar basal body L-ring protein FlgH [Limnohabitans sp. 2KL-27]
MNKTLSLPCAIGIVLVLGLSGCASPSAPMAHSPQFAPVLPVAVEKPKMATGAIYNGRQSDNWFGRVRSYNVGDVITVLLNESTQAGRTQSGSIKRAASNDVIPSVTSAPNGLNARVQGMRLPTQVLGTRLQGIMGGVDLSRANIESVGSGEAGQQASLIGDVSVTVIEVLANGNLMVRGEKQLALTEGAEIIQVNGIIRPEDISPNNTVQSRRLANAQIAYRGTGDMANAAKAGWGTNALMKFWPF